MKKELSYNKNSMIKEKLFNHLKKLFNQISEQDRLIIFHFILFVFTFGIGNIIYFIYEYSYFKRKEFIKIKNKVEDHIKECNELNDHIEDLKATFMNIEKTDYGEAKYVDNSNFQYKRPQLNKYKQSNYIYHCSREICNNARQQPFKYLCKYFNINIDENTLAKFENILNNFSAVEDGKKLLKKQREKIIESISIDIPLLIKYISCSKLIKKLGFKKINFSQLYFPKYTFQYISSGGNSSTNCSIIFDINTLNRFVNYLSGRIKFKNSIAGQRALMTSKLREKIKQRDNYTCQECNNSTSKEPNLLLEIDHIIPLSKGGMTSESNLQTLCWKCNRKKGAKYEAKK